MLQNQDVRYTMTTSSGAASQTVSGFGNRRLVQMMLIPATASTEFDVTITDKNSKTIPIIADTVGSFITYRANLPEFVYGNFTLNIANATADEAFAVTLIFSEESF